MDQAVEIEKTRSVARVGRPVRNLLSLADGDERAFQIALIAERIGQYA
jgi:hypothetical protein